MFQFPSCPSRKRDDGSLHPPGCPIRKSVDHCALAAPYRVSPLGTSFLGTPPLGIPQKPCVSLETTLSPHACLLSTPITYSHPQTPIPNPHEPNASLRERRSKPLELK